jgi:hypothetical protein
MTHAIRAQIVDDMAFTMGGISFRIAEVEIGHEGWPVRTIRILRRPDTADGYVSWYLPTEEERMMAPQGSDLSVWNLPEGCGEALLEALTRHYNRGQPTADARAYYELWKHESERRDAAEDQLSAALVALLHNNQTNRQTEPGVLAGKLADFLPAIAMRLPHSTETFHTELVFHNGVQGCLGHMPYDIMPHCTNVTER